MPLLRTLVPSLAIIGALLGVGPKDALAAKYGSDSMGAPGTRGRMSMGSDGVLRSTLRPSGFAPRQVALDGKTGAKSTFLVLENGARVSGAQVTVNPKTGITTRTNWVAVN